MVSYIEGEHKLSVLESKVLRRIFGPKRDEVTGELRKLHEEEHYDLYSPNTTRVIKLGRMRLVGHVEGMGRQERCVQRFGWEPKGKNHLEDLLVDRRIILKLIFKK